MFKGTGLLAPYVSGSHKEEESVSVSKILGKIISSK